MMFSRSFKNHLLLWRLLAWSVSARPSSVLVLRNDCCKSKSVCPSVKCPSCCESFPSSPVKLPLGIEWCSGVEWLWDITYYNEVSCKVRTNLVTILVNSRRSLSTSRCSARHSCSSWRSRDSKLVTWLDDSSAFASASANCACKLACSSNCSWSCFSTYNNRYCITVDAFITHTPWYFIFCFFT